MLSSGQVQVAAARLTARYGTSPLTAISKWLNSEAIRQARRRLPNDNEGAARLFNQLKNQYDTLRKQEAVS